MVSFDYPGNSNSVCTVLQKWHLHTTTVLKTRNASNINMDMESGVQGWVGSWIAKLWDGFIYVKTC